MTTDNSNLEADNEAPPVARILGFAVSEWVVYSMVCITVIAVIFGLVVGGERDVQVERAMATLAALTEEAESRVAAGAELVCDNTLLDPELLANDYLTLSISQAPINEEDESLGYGPALYLSVAEKQVSGDTWDTAKRLKERVEEVGKEKEKEAAKANENSADRNLTSNAAADDEEAGGKNKKPKNALRKISKTSFGESEKYLRYYILASEVASCSEFQGSEPSARVKS